MFNMVLTNGEKIRKLREGLGITLEELACGEVKKSYLSMIENNKRNLTEDKAEIIARKINRIAQDKRKYFDFTISAKTLIEDEETQAKSIIELRFASAENNFDEAEKLFEIAERYKINEYMIKLCAKLSDYYFNDNIERSIEYAQKGLYTSIQLDDIVNCIKFETKLVKISLRTKNFKDALIRSKNILNSININDIKDYNIFNNVHYNFSITYIELGEYNLALEHAHKIKVEYLEKHQLIDLSIVIANAYFVSEQVEVAISKYKKILRYKLSDETKARVFRNLSESYYKIEQYAKSLKYIQQCIDIRKENKSNYLSDTLVFSSHVYEAVNNIDMCKSCLLQSIELDCNSEALEKLVDLYIMENNIIETTNLIKNYAEKFNIKTLINVMDIYINIDISVSRQILRVLKRKNL